jgi:prefoldin subunit 5
MRLDGRGGFMALDDSKIEKVQFQFQALSTVASSLNSASDELTKVVSILDEALKKLNVGLTAWVAFRVRQDDEHGSGNYDLDQIGYCKVNGKWGIALRRIWGNANFDADHAEGPWLFNDAPRDMRLYAVDKIPELIDALNNAASETTMKVQEKTLEIRKLAGAIEQITKQPRRFPRLRPDTAAIDALAAMSKKGGK